MDGFVCRVIWRMGGPGAYWGHTIMLIQENYWHDDLVPIMQQE